MCTLGYVQWVHADTYSTLRMKNQLTSSESFTIMGVPSSVIPERRDGGGYINE